MTGEDTKIVATRLDEIARVRLDYIQRSRGLENVSEAIRYAIHSTFFGVVEEECQARTARANGRRPQSTGGTGVAVDRRVRSDDS